MNSSRCGYHEPQNLYNSRMLPDVFHFLKGPKQRNAWLRQVHLFRYRSWLVLFCQKLCCTEKCKPKTRIRSNGTFLLKDMAILVILHEHWGQDDMRANAHWKITRQSGFFGRPKNSLPKRYVQVIAKISQKSPLICACACGIQTAGHVIGSWGLKGHRRTSELLMRQNNNITVRGPVAASDV